jgi:hypothetical protein
VSHDATNWAIKQRGIKPALKVVLWNLCDRYHPDNGCFPSQDTLAADCEVPRSTLNVYLKELEDAGLIAREQRRERGSNRQERTRYRFPFEPDFPTKSAEEPGPESGHGAESRNGPEPSPENAESRVQNLDSNPVREPVKETSNEREGAGAKGEDDLREMERRHDALRIGRHGNPWPLVLNQSKDWSFRQFLALTPEERLLAEERRDAYLAACPKIRSGDRKGEPDAVVLGVYLRDKLFKDVDAIAPRAVQRGVADVGTVAMPAFGPVWAGLRALRLLDGVQPFDLPLDLRERVQSMFDVFWRRSPEAGRAFAARRGLDIAGGGLLVFPEDFEQAERQRRAIEEGFPEVIRLHQQAKERAHASVERRYAGLADLCEPVPVDSGLFCRWRDYHERMGWPFIPDPGRMPVVYFPKGGPDELANFERLARGIENEAPEVQGDEHAA